MKSEIVSVDGEKSQGWISKILTGKDNPEPVLNRSHSSLLAVGESIYEIQSHFLY